MTNGQAPVPVIDGIPVTGMLGPWRWTLSPIGTDSGTGETIYLFRLYHAGGMTELFAPASFVRKMAEDLALSVSGLHIARDVPPHPGGGEG